MTKIYTNVTYTNSCVTHCGSQAQPQQWHTANFAAAAMYCYPEFDCLKNKITKFCHENLFLSYKTLRYNVEGMDVR